MRLILSTLFVLIVALAAAQTYTPVTGRYAYQWSRNDSAIALPFVLSPNALNGSIAIRNDTLFRKWAGEWAPVRVQSSGSAGGPTNSIQFKTADGGLNGSANMLFDLTKSTLTGDTLDYGRLKAHSLRLSLTDSINYVHVPVGAKTSQGVLAPSKAFVFSNRPLWDDERSDFKYWVRRGGNALIWAERFFKEKNNDTASVQYNGVFSSLNRYEMDPLSNRFDSATGKPYIPQLGGAYFVNQLSPIKNTIVKTYPFGQTMSAYTGTIGLGSDDDFIINFQRDARWPVPPSVYQSDIDFDRNLKGKQRIVRGMITGYLAHWKSRQDGAPVETGSKVDTVADYLSSGSLYSTPVTGSPSKNQILAESSVGSAIGFYSRPKRTETNEVVNGYGVIQDGADDINSYQGRSYFGFPVWPQYSDTLRDKVIVNGSLYSSKIRLNKDSSFASNNTDKVALLYDTVTGQLNRTSVVPFLNGGNAVASTATLGVTTDRNLNVVTNNKVRAVFGNDASDFRLKIDQTDYVSDLETGFPGGIRADADRVIANNLTGDLRTYFMAGDGTRSAGTTTLLNSFSNNSAGALFYRLFTATPGNTHTVNGPTNAHAAVATMFVKGGATSAQGAVTMNGWYTAIATALQANNPNLKQVENFIDINTGLTSLIDGTSIVKNRFALYVQPLRSNGNYVNTYGLFQSGAADKNYFAGRVKMGGDSSTNGDQVQVEGRISATLPSGYTHNLNGLLTKNDFATKGFVDSLVATGGGGGGGSTVYDLSERKTVTTVDLKPTDLILINAASTSALTIEVRGTARQTVTNDIARFHRSIWAKRTAGVLSLENEETQSPIEGNDVVAEYVDPALAGIKLTFTKYGSYIVVTVIGLLSTPIKWDFVVTVTENK